MNKGCPPEPEARVDPWGSLTMAKICWVSPSEIVDYCITFYFVYIFSRVFGSALRSFLVTSALPHQTHQSPKSSLGSSVLGELLISLNISVCSDNVPTISPSLLIKMIHLKTHNLYRPHLSNESCCSIMLKWSSTCPENNMKTIITIPQVIIIILIITITLSSQFFSIIFSKMKNYHQHPFNILTLLFTAPSDSSWFAMLTWATTPLMWNSWKPLQFQRIYCVTRAPLLNTLYKELSSSIFQSLSVTCLDLHFVQYMEA